MQRFKDWFKALSTIGKVFVISLLALVGIGTASAMSGSQPTPTPQNVSTTKTSTLATCNGTKATTTETEDIPSSKTTVDDSSLDSGKTYIQTAGVNGVRTLSYDVVTYKPVGCKTDTKLQVSSIVTTEPINEVTVVGTKAKQASNCDPNYSPCIPYYSGNALNCPDIRIRVTVVGIDHNRFDADGDGIGCESY